MDDPGRIAPDDGAQGRRVAGWASAAEAAGGRHEAQQRTVRELVAFGGVPAGARVLDSGCGIGASAIMLAKDLDCTVDGITLSHEQVRRVEEKAAAAGVSDRTRFRVMDALHVDYPDETFDAVWSMESCELMPDKRAYLAECARVLKPGGTLVVATWCSRDDKLTGSEVRLLRARGTRR